MGNWELGGNYPGFDPNDSNNALNRLRYMNQQQVAAHEGEIKPMRGGLPNWAPGEFDEWKAAKVNKLPTTYGFNMQRRMNDKTGLTALIDQGADNANDVMGRAGFNPLMFLMGNR